jgi:Uma2 family endonuclease
VFVIDEDRWTIATTSKEYPSGSPQLPIEVLSPSTERVDRQIKVPKYLAAGALAVWLVDPDARSLTVVDASGSVTLQSSEHVHLPEALGSGPIRISDIFPKRHG